mmetsp:Transcript_14035/g.41107  ORF Transcript_14035/g.41107 Transcript_14035/m.41107 type:complete len:94 (+) Transcript_14035:549-830(+)
MNSSDVLLSLPLPVRQILTLDQILRIYASAQRRSRGGTSNNSPADRLSLFFHCVQGTYVCSSSTRAKGIRTYQRMIQYLLQMELEDQAEDRLV